MNDWSFDLSPRNTRSSSAWRRLRGLMATETSERAETGVALGGPPQPYSLGVSAAASVGGLLLVAVVGITLVGGVISRYLIALKPVVAIGVALLGLGLVADIRLPSIALPLGRVGGRIPPAAGLFFYGFGYALASTGCTLPIYVSIIVLPLTSGFPVAAR